jgi:hypothetical protein
MNRLIGIVLIYAAMMLAWTGAGLFMLIAPARFGNLVHDNLYLFPQVTPRDWGKKLVLRFLGLGLLAFAIRLAVRIAHQAS